MDNFRNRITLLAVFLCLLTTATSAICWSVAGQSLVPLLLGGIAGTAASALICNLVLSPVDKGLKILLDNTDKAIKGDLTCRIEDGDFGWGQFNQLMINTRKVLKGITKWFGKIIDASRNLDQAAGQLLSGTDQVSKGSQNQAEQVQQLLRGIENLSTLSERSARAAEEAAQAARDSDHTAQLGNEVIREMSKGMDLINEKIARLDQSSTRAGQFLKVINDIASQTNLLALNAAIEAARAGNQGRGFAVVAEEVRKLAENSARATQEVAQIIEEIRESVTETVEAVKQGLSLSERAGQAFMEITRHLEKTRELVEQITRAIREEAETTQSMLSSAQSIAAIAQEAAASSEETAAIAQTLTVTADELKKIASIWHYGT